MTYEGETGEFFELQKLDSFGFEGLITQRDETLKIIWFKEKSQLLIDKIEYNFSENQIIFLTQFHNIEVISLQKAEILSFNRPFYCVVDHDSEVGCKGVLFYGSASEIPIINLRNEDLEIMQTVWKLSNLEFEMRDSLQLEMLQMMLKRILILSTRILKRDSCLQKITNEQNNIIREFNYLVEKHFRTKHSVSEYAELLYKSPKTIANTFKKLGEKSPLQFIQERILLEARRMLFYTDKDVSEIGYELGFQDVQSFSRFFKKQEGKSPTDYRSNC
ncbi:helix-turn-helix domain-containing protein [Crocinitomix algicola]|uniref:helix-turn-helix domain-containing protein n=1 Tax=Crocinitomix algicola TaxID=1740263 RepID=UPI00087312E6|nr:helix-turn-helix domain-containing protein [Crocinitomix algicola]